MNLIEKLYNSLYTNTTSKAFYINEVFYTYKQLQQVVENIRYNIQQQINDSVKLIGLVTNNDLETYAAILALWFEGKGYVPLNSNNPIERNKHILELTDVIHIIDSSEHSNYSEYQVIKSKYLESITFTLKLPHVNLKDLAYVLFTSGSTGTPKGVPISFYNLNSFVTAIDKDSNFRIVNTDRCLQMFELTFDMSVVSYLLPLLEGACIYTIPQKAIKYFYVFKLIKEQKLTVLTLVASIIHYLKPYFEEINAPDVRFCSFAGGSLYTDIASQWSSCIPNCKIFNYYGPTETTIYSGYYPYNKHTHTKSHNGIISIGTPMGDLNYIIVDHRNNELPIGKTGELCISGGQVTSGYWKNETRNKTSFFIKMVDNRNQRFYKTGDLCYKDKDGNFMYIGRSDFQVKIRGFRVELAEIEHHAKTISKKVNIIALDVINKLGNAELALAIEGKPFDDTDMISYMKTKMPDYMIPTHIKYIEELPHNMNGKVDRKTLKTYFKLD